jgi:hypothetical protein
MRTPDHRPEPGSRVNASVFESFDAFAEVLRGPAAAADRGARGQSPAEPPGGTGADAAIFRPLLRSPMALLHVVDDGREDGEVVRCRGQRLVIGRADADVTIPHDISMATPHAAIERLADGGWQLVDLSGPAGTFVRVTRAKLRHGTTVQVGRTRLSFHTVDPAEAWLIEVTPTGFGRRYECRAPLTTLGRTGFGTGIEINDPCISELHARVVQTARGWKIENSGLNGLWMRIEAPVKLGATSQFLCGEQRFVFEPL